MASTTCLRCLARSINSVTRPLPPYKLSAIQNAAAFSTCASFAMPAPMQKHTGTSSIPERGSKALRLKKKTRTPKARPPATADRKALRKRIVLSNTNALEVPGLEEFDLKTVTDEAARGRMLMLPDAAVDFLRAVQAFRMSQGWSLFRRPAVLVRQETVEMATLIHFADWETRGKAVRRVITGELGTGKSVLLLQAMAMAFQKGWVVMSIPEGHHVTNASVAYAPLPGTSPPQYVQPTYISTFLSQISKANDAVLSNLELSQEHELPIPVQSNISLFRLADLGASDPQLAWPIFQALWTELTAPSTTKTPRPPIMLAMDGLNYMMRDSEYLNPAVKPIHAHDLALVRHFTDHLSGKRALPNGGMILAATSESNPPSTPAMDHALSCSEAKAAGMPVPQWDPYRNIDERVLQSLRGVDVVRLKGLSRDEARSVMEYYAASGMLRHAVNEAFVSEKWTLAGGGIIGEIERGTVRERI